MKTRKRKTPVADEERIEYEPRDSVQPSPSSSAINDEPHIDPIKVTTALVLIEQNRFIKIVVRSFQT